MNTDQAFEHLKSGGAVAPTTNGFIAVEPSKIEFAEIAAPEMANFRNIDGFCFLVVPKSGFNEFCSPEFAVVNGTTYTVADGGEVGQDGAPLSLWLLDENEQVFETYNLKKFDGQSWYYELE